MSSKPNNDKSHQKLEEPVTTESNSKRTTYSFSNFKLIVRYLSDIQYHNLILCTSKSIFELAHFKINYVQPVTF